MATQLIKVNKVGVTSYHVFVDALGNEVFEEINPQQYRKIGPAEVLTRPGLTWKYSIENTPTFNTPSKRMEDNNYADFGDGTSAVKLPGMGALEYKYVKSEEISLDGTLSAEAELTITPVILETM